MWWACVAIFASLLASPPVAAATFHCGKTFVTFEGKQGGISGIITVRKDAIIHVLTSTNGDVSSLRIRNADGDTEAIAIDEATHDRLVECLD